MTTQPQHETPMASEGSRRHDERAAMHRSGSTHQTEFDPHRWLERYRAAHSVNDFSDRLLGVPFN